MISSKSNPQIAVSEIVDNMDQLPIQKELQERIGLLPKVHIREDPSSGRRILYAQVSSLSEITRLVRASRTLGLRVRASNVPCCLATDEFDVIIDCDAISDEERIEAFHCRSEAKGGDDRWFVKVKPGVTVKEFSGFCQAHDLCLPSLPDSPKLSMVELVITGGHGIATGHATVSDFLTEIRIVDADGYLKSYKAEPKVKSDSILTVDVAKDLFSGAQCSLGMFGIVYDATFEVTSNFTVKVTTEFKPLEEILLDSNNLTDLVSKNEYISLVWFPFNSVQSEEDIQKEIFKSSRDLMTELEHIENIIEKKSEHEFDKSNCQTPSTALRTPAPQVFTMEEWTPEKDEVFCRLMNTNHSISQSKKEFDLFNLEYFKDRKGVFIEDPNLTVNFLRSTHRRHKMEQPSHSDYCQYISWGTNWINPNTYPANMNTLQYVFDTGKNFSNLIFSMERVTKRVIEYKEKQQFPLNGALIISFTKASSALMAPSHCGHQKHGGSGLSCSVTLFTFLGTPGLNDFLTDFEMDMRSIHGARPYWNVHWTMIDGTYSLLKSVYGDCLDKFKDMLRKQLIDLDGVFLNDHLAKVVDSEEFSFQKKYTLKNKNTKDTMTILN